MFIRQKRRFVFRTESAVYKLVYNGLTNALLYDNREADAFVPPPIPEPPAASSFQAPAPARHTLPEIWTRTEAVREEREILPAAPSAPAEEPALPETPETLPADSFVPEREKGCASCGTALSFIIVQAYIRTVRSSDRFSIHIFYCNTGTKWC